MLRPRKNESREDFIARLVKSAPPLTRAQRARIAEILEAEIGPPEALGANKAIPLTGQEDCPANSRSRKAGTP